MLDLTINILSLGGPSFNPKIRLIWDTDHIDNTSFEIYRAIGRDDPVLLTTVPGTGVQSYSYDDTVVELGNGFKRYSYKIIAILTNGNTREETDLECWDTHHRLFEMQIMKMQEYYYKYQAGTPYFMFSRRFLKDDKCPVCWDIAEHRVRTPREGCQICYGTGIQNPFYDPIDVWCTTSSDQNDQSLIDNGRMTDDQFKIDCNGTPRINPGDFLLDNKDRTFYSVKKVEKIGQRHAPIRQIITIHKEPAESSMYRWLSISDAIIKDLNTEIVAIQKERRF